MIPSVSEQYALNWRLRFFNMFPAYCIVGTFAIIQFIRPKPIRNSWSDAQNRLFISWFVVAFCLANHEILIKPLQPLHFTRGYIWTSLMLFGIPALHVFFEALSRSRRRKIVLSIFLLLFFSDNLTWIGFSASSKDRTASASYIGKEHQIIFDTLNSRFTNQSLIVGNDLIIPYMSTVYTKGYPFYSHPFITPHAAAKEASVLLFMKQGIIDPAWKGRDIYFIFQKNDSIQQRRSLSLNFQARRILETENYRLMKAEIPKSIY